MSNNHHSCPHNHHHQSSTHNHNYPHHHHHHHHPHCKFYNQNESEKREKQQRPLPISSSPDIVILEDNDKLSIISTENIKRFSILPCRNSNNNIINDTGDGSRALNHPFIRKWINAVGIIDIILFTASLILAFTTERYVCHDGPVQLGRFKGFINYDEPVQQSPTVFEYVMDGVLENLKLNSPFTYHLTVIAILALCTTYFVLEIWLFCLLIKLANTPRISSSIKWLSYRSLILSIILLITVYDVGYSHQATCSELVLVPIQVLRSIIGGVPVMWVIWSGGVGRW